MRRSATLLALLLLLASGARAQTPGSCALGTAQGDLDVSNVFARVFNTGSLFFGNTTTNGDGYIVPRFSGHSPIFAAGLWVGGTVNGEVRVAGSRYTNFTFWPGPLNDDGTLPEPRRLLRLRPDLRRQRRPTSTATRPRARRRRTSGTGRSGSARPPWTPAASLWR